MLSCVTFELDYDTLQIKAVRLFVDGSTEEAFLSAEEQRVLMLELMAQGFELRQKIPKPTFERSDLP